jgi:hypothetical protein
MVILGDEGQMKARFGLFGDSANLDEVHGLRQMFHTPKIDLDAPDGTSR